MINVLFLCTGNSARSILAERLMSHLGAGRFKGFSAGSQPTGVVNAFALTVLHEHGLDAAGVSSKSWEAFGTRDAPTMDFIFTVCDSAAAETCPIWPGHPVSAHWGLVDPAAVEGGDDAKRGAFEIAFGILHRRITAFVALDPSAMEPQAFTAKLREIGAM